MRPKSCTVCSRKTLDGASRCPLHKVGSSRKRPCVICSRASQGNYCELHKPETDERLRLAKNPYRKAYSSGEYARNRRHRFKKAYGRCEACGIELQPANWECDHLIPLRKGGTNELSNLRVLCKPCHKLKTAEDKKRWSKE